MAMRLVENISEPLLLSIVSCFALRQMLYSDASDYWYLCMHVCLVVCVVKSIVDVCMYGRVCVWARMHHSVCNSVHVSQTVT